MKKEFYNLVATGLAFLILVLPGSLSARERRGANVIVTLKDGHFSAGELIAVKPDSLLLLAGKDESVDLIGIRSIRIVRKSKAGLGGVYGFLAGALIMGIAVALDPIEGGAGDAIGLGIFFGGIPVGFIGLGVGAIAGTDKTIQFEGKSESEVRQALAYLRKKARIRD
jgi:hypothetical protein